MLNICKLNYVFSNAHNTRRHSHIVTHTVYKYTCALSLFNTRTHIHTQVIGKVSIEVVTCADEGPRKKHTDLLKKIG